MPKKSSEPKRQRRFANTVPISLTGLLTGERCRVESSPAWATSTMVVARGMVPPSKTIRLQHMHDFHPFDDADDAAIEIHYWERVYDHVKHRPGLTSADDFRIWVLANEVDKDASGNVYTSAAQIDEADDLQIVIESLGGEAMNDPQDVVIEPENLELLIDVPMHPMAALRLFSFDSEAVADTSRRRLLFTLDYWQSVPVEDLDDESFHATVLDVSQPEPEMVSLGGLSEQDRRRLVHLVSDHASVYVLPEPSGAAAISYATPAERAALASDALGSPVPEALIAKLCTLSLSVLKSLMQKTIRCGARSVALSASDVYSGPAVLVATMVSMLGKKTVSEFGSDNGLPAMLRRLVMICFEDAWPNEHRAAAQVACAAVYSAVADKARTWVPSRPLMISWLRLAVKALQSSEACVYNLAAGASVSRLRKPPSSAKDYEVTVVCYMFDNFLRGSEDDRNMIRSVALCCAGRSVLAAVRPSPTLCYTSMMPVEHCMDQYCVPSMILMASADGPVFAAIDDTKPAPSSPVMRRIFDEITGLNPRRHAAGAGPYTQISTLIPRTAEQAAFYNEIRSIQVRAWSAITGAHMLDSATFANRRPDGSMHTLLSRGLIAHAVGLRTIVHNNRTYHWSLNPEDPNSPCVALKRTVRTGLSNNADDADNADEFPAVRAAVIKLLKDDGIQCSFLGKRDTSVRLQRDGDDDDDDDDDGDDDGRLVLTVNGTPWHQLCNNAQISVDTADWTPGVPAPDTFVCRRVPLDPLRCVAAIRAIIQRTEVRPRALALSMLLSHNSELRFPHPDRDGSITYGNNFLLTRTSVLAWAMCKDIADLSAQLLAPRVGSINVFVTGRSFIELRRSLVIQAVNQTISYQPLSTLDGHLNVVREWFVAHSGGQQPHDHQMRALQKMARRAVTGGHRGHFVWIDAGGGKTLMFVMFARLMAALRGEQPARARMVFVTSTSALMTIKADVERVGIRCAQVSTPANTAAAVADQNVACLVIGHNALRNQAIMDKLAPLLTSCAVAIDEVHECTGEATLRSGAAQTAAAYAQTLVLMSATPLRSIRSVGKLRELVQHTVSFPCATANDLLVAAPSMVREQLDAKIATTSVFEEAPSVPEDCLLDDVPVRLGGRSQQTTFNPPALKRAMDAATAVCNRHMVTLVKRELADGFRPFVVCKDGAHCQTMAALLRAAGIAADKMIVIAKPADVQSQCADGVHDEALQVAVVTISVCLGYSFTWFNVRIRAVYPSNEASRYQIDRRIARTGQTVSPVRLITVHCGIMTTVMRNHLFAESMGSMMRELNAMQ